MPEEMNWKKFLTDNVLHEVWHEPKITAGRCGCSCGQNYYLPSSYNCQNRTFDNQDDLVELYNKIKRDKKWKEFEDFLFSCWHGLFLFHEDEKRGYVRWLLCLNNDECRERCEIITRFYGYDKEEEK